MRFEVCVDSIEGVRAARAAGADRVELCADLVEGGTTPSLGAIRRARTIDGLRLHVMIRPRGGDFLYSEDELAAMEQDIAIAKAEGADGVVFGLLLPDGTVDAERTARLIEAARPMAVTFHRAFDLAAEAVAALETLAELGAERVLTSGQAESALAGLPVIADLVRRADGRVIVMPGGGINSGNVRKIVRQSGCREVHFAALEAAQSGMKFRRPGVAMGNGAAPGEFSRSITTKRAIRAVMARAQP